MNGDTWLWICVAFYAAHILEEFTYDWKTWAEKTSGIPLNWGMFFVTNAAVIVLGICCAQVGWQLPEFSLIFPSLMFINAVFFHLVPSLRSRKFSPGLLTAFFLFLPVTLWMYYETYLAGILTPRALLVSTLGAVLTMLFPVGLAKTRDWDTFQQ